MNARAHVLAIVATGALGLAIALQGWAARGPDTDVIGALVRTAALVERGVVPQRGTLTDLNSYRPPGTSWLALPGVILFDDPRLVELAGSAPLYLVALVMTFLLTRYCFGPGAAVAATIAYGLSAIALNLAGQLWPKAHPVFAAAMTYCALRWAHERRGVWLLAALTSFSAGLYEHFEMTPFFLMLPALWWWRRPPVTWRVTATALVIGVVMWAPYLEFESHRQFIDVRSQLSMTPLDRLGGEIVPWCGDTPVPAGFAPPRTLASKGRASRVAAIGELLVSNFNTRVPTGSLLLLLAFAAGCWTIMLRGEGPARSLLVALGAPAIVFLLLAVPGEERLLGIWPMQVAIVMASAAGSVSIDALSWPRRWLLAALVAIVAANPVSLSRLHAWNREGWSGASPVTVDGAGFRTIVCEDEAAR